MVSDRIEKLIEKYENAETTLQEEQELKAYFALDKVAPHLQSYQPLFNYFSQTRDEQFTGDLPLKTEKKYFAYRWISVAAVVVVLLGLTLSNPFAKAERTYAELSFEEKQQYDEAMLAFNLLGANFKKGTDNLTAIDKLSESLNVGEANFALLGEFDETTDRVFSYD